MGSFNAKIPKGDINSMVKHVVFFKMKENVEGESWTPRESAAKLAEVFNEMGKKIPQLKVLETGVNFNTEEYDLILYTEMADKNALQEYLDHPEHKAAGKFVKKVMDHRTVIDYEV